MPDIIVPFLGYCSRLRHKARAQSREPIASLEKNWLLHPNIGIIARIKGRVYIGRYSPRCLLATAARDAATDSGTQVDTARTQVPKSLHFLAYYIQSSPCVTDVFSHFSSLTYNKVHVLCII